MSTHAASAPVSLAAASPAGNASKALVIGIVGLIVSAIGFAVSGAHAGALSYLVGITFWTAIAIGFVGVLIALKPSSASLTSAALFSILGSAAFAFMMLSGRQLRNTPDTVLAFWQIIGAALAGIVAVFITPSGWLPVQSSFDLAFLGLLGVVAMTAHVLVNRALKLADAATVAPLQYTLLLWAVLFGWMFFGDAPRPAMLVGAGFIVASGLFIFFREQQLKRRGG